MPLMMDRNGDGTPETPWPNRCPGSQFRSDLIDQHDQRRNVSALPRAAPAPATNAARFSASGHDIHATSEAVAALGGGEGRHCVACHEPSPTSSSAAITHGGDLMASDYEIAHLRTSWSAPLATPPQLYQVCGTCCITPGRHGVRNLPYSVFLRHHVFTLRARRTTNFGRNNGGMDSKLITADQPAR